MFARKLICFPISIMSALSETAQLASGCFRTVSNAFRAGFGLLERYAGKAASREGTTVPASEGRAEVRQE